MKYKTAIVDDHKIFRDGFKMVLSSIDNVEITCEASNGQEFLDLLDKGAKPELVFMDINMPVLDGFETSEQALKKQPGLKIIALTSFDGIDYINKMLYAGVEGYLLKDADYEEIEEAINNVMTGQNYFSKKILVNLTKNTIKKNEEDKKKLDLPKLSRRELEVLKMLCKGYTKIDIAEKLFISDRTVEKHKENLMHKTKTKSTVNLVIFALKHKIADLA